MAHPALPRVVDRVDPAANRVRGISLDEARRRVGSGDPALVRSISGSFAIAASAEDGETVRLARSLDRPMRFFLAKQKDGPLLVVSDRIDAIRDFLREKGLDAQFHPSYTRMVPAHHVVEIRLVGCPDPDAAHTRFLAPARGSGAAALDSLGARYVGAMADEIESWLAEVPAGEPVGVFFSGGVDSGAVFLATRHAFGRLGLPLSRLKAFTLSIGGAEDAAQARDFLRGLGLELFLEEVEAPAEAADPFEAVRVVEDYKPLDVESDAMALALCRGVRERYPDWKYVLDGDGGDENLKDYPLGEDENSELTIRSVLMNPLLYQEGWGVGTLKHSRTYSGGFSRACARTWAPLRRYGFEGLSPFTAPAVVEAAEAIPFITLTGWDVERLYALKGEIVARGIRALTGLDMPAFPKRRFQHGALAAGARDRIRFTESDYRGHFASLYDAR